MKSRRLLACFAVFLGAVLTGSVQAASETGASTNEPPSNPDPQQLVWIKPGTFMMGSPSNELYRMDDEGPQTQVTISHGFWMSKYETTQEKYLALMGNNPARFTGDMKSPVEQVSWNDATNYCGKLTQQERSAGRLPVGYAYRLPTEAEWEYACRAGTTNRFSYGDDLDCASLKNYAWFRDNSERKTHPVGQKLPNAWGLYDMHGNVWEWCSDWYGTFPGGRVTDPKSSASDSSRVMRGGSWRSSGTDCRTAVRRNDWPDYKLNRGVGLRPVLAPAL